MVRTGQTGPGAEPRLVVTQRARLTRLQPVPREHSGLALRCNTHTQRERDTHRDTHTQTDTERETQTHTDTHTQTHTGTDRHRERDTNTHRDTHTHAFRNVKVGIHNAHCTLTIHWTMSCVCV